MLNEGLKPPISKWEWKMGAVVFVQQLDLLLPPTIWDHWCF